MSQSRFQIWLEALRPKTLFAAVSPVLIGTTAAYADGGFHLLSAMAAAVGALLIQVGTNFANDYFDFRKGSDSGERFGPVRATQAGLVAPETMKKATALAFGLALLVGVYLVWRGGWPVVAIGLFSILFGVLYTGGPYPLAYHGLGDIFVLIFFGPVAVAGTYYVQTMTVTVPVVIAGLAPGFLSVAILTVNNLRDIEGDRNSGKKTLAVRFGRRFTVTEFVSCILAAVLIPDVLVLWWDMTPYLLISTGALFLALPAIGQIRHTKGTALNNTLAATGRLLFAYCLLLSIGWLL